MYVQVRVAYLDMVPRKWAPAALLNRLILNKHSVVSAGILPENGPAGYVVLDHAERLAGSPTLASLLRTRQLTGRTPP